MNQTYINNKVIKGFIIGAVIFFICIPIIMAAISYLPNWMLESDLTGFEYFKANFFNDFGLKLVIATFVSPFVTVAVTFIAFKLLDIRDEKREKNFKNLDK